MVNSYTAAPDIDVLTSNFPIPGYGLVPINAFGIMGLSNPLPMDRVFLVNPGETVTVGGRTLTAVRPPVFDNPSPTGFYDATSGAFFSSDCFGALLSEVPQNAVDLSDTGRMIERMLASLAAAPGAQPFVGPNQAALGQMLKGMTAGGQ